MIKHKEILLLALIFGLFAAMVGSICDPFLSKIRAAQPPDVSDYWRGTVDGELKHMNAQIKGLADKLDNVCDDIINVRVKAAESGGVYGGASAIIVYLIGLFVKTILEKRNGKKLRNDSNP